MSSNPIAYETQLPIDFCLGFPGSGASHLTRGEQEVLGHNVLTASPLKNQKASLPLPTNGKETETGEEFEAPFAGGVRF